MRKLCWEIHALGIINKPYMATFTKIKNLIQKAMYCKKCIVHIQYICTIHQTHIFVCLLVDKAFVQLNNKVINYL